MKHTLNFNEIITAARLKACLRLLWNKNQIKSANVYVNLHLMEALQALMFLPKVQQDCIFQFLLRN